MKRLLCTLLLALVACDETPPAVPSKPHVHIDQGQNLTGSTTLPDMTLTLVTDQDQAVGSGEVAAGQLHLTLQDPLKNAPLTGQLSQTFQQMTNGKCEGQLVLNTLQVSGPFLSSVATLYALPAQKLQGGDPRQLIVLVYADQEATFTGENHCKQILTVGGVLSEIDTHLQADVHLQAGWNGIVYTNHDFSDLGLRSVPLQEIPERLSQEGGG